MKEFFRGLTPPYLWKLMISVDMRLRPHPDYTGIYGSFGECQQATRRLFKKLGSFNSPHYTGFAMVEWVFQTRTPSHEQSIRYSWVKYILEAQRLLDHHSRIEIIDVGGGMGFLYALLKNFLGKDIERVNYTIIEVPGIVAMGEDIFSGDKNVNFRITLPTESNCDMVVFSSSLQYLDDYEGILRHVCGWKPRCIFMTRLPAGNVPNFVTLQHFRVPLIVTPVWAFNYDGLIQLLRGMGYLVVEEWEEEGNLHLTYEKKSYCISHFRGMILGECNHGA